MVPLNQIERAFELVKDQIPSDVNVTPILNYFEKTWVNGAFPPPTWNQFGEFDERTNNNVEAYNKQVNRKLKVKPGLLKFIDFLIKEENKMSISILQSDKEPFYNKVQTKTVKYISNEFSIDLSFNINFLLEKDKLKNEEILLTRLTEAKITLSDYIGKYAANVEINAVEMFEDEVNPEEYILLKFQKKSS